MAENFFEDLIAWGIPADGTNVNEWILNQFKDNCKCSLDEFSAFYLNLIKSQTDEFMKFSTSTCNTPRKPKLSVSLDVQESPIPLVNTEDTSLLVKKDRRRELFGNSKNDSITSLNNSSTFNESTPVQVKKRNFNLSEASTSTPKNAPNRNSLSFDKSSNFKNSTKNSLDFSANSRNNSMNKRNISSPMCLADFMNTSVNSQHDKSQQRSKKNDKSPASFSKSDFPSLGGKEEPVKKEKPKKRVVPLTVSKKCTSDGQQFASSSFTNENNLLNVTPSDEIDIMKNRKVLCEERVDVSKKFQVEMQQTPEKNLRTMLKESLPIANSPVRSQSTSLMPSLDYDSSKVERKELLHAMAQLYSFLLDMNLVANVLAEFSNLFALLNADSDPFESLKSGCANASILETASSVLKNLNNCIYFVMNVLRLQKTSLALLDAMTIRVILDNERFQQISPDLTEFFKSMLQQKMQLNTEKVGNKSFSNNIVFYQQETDNLDNFPSSREFQAFRKQRDMFYEVLRFWEVKHLDPNWDFRRGLEIKIRSLITLLDHPINMAHLARLFTAQIIVSCNFDDPTNELQSVLPNVDLQKLSKLRQRLITPSAFSSEYLFPGTQAFFRDFILCCDHHRVFMEQLKISMISELIQINDSSIEMFCILPVGSDGMQIDTNGDYVVQAETMVTMKILAKFIGFIVSRPYEYEGYRNTIVDQKQFKMRNAVSLKES